LAGDDSTDKSQKTEQPTPKKLEDARKRGQTVNSREVNNWIVMLAATILIGTSVPGILSDFKDLFKNFMDMAYALPTDSNGITIVMKELFLAVAKIIIMPLLVISFSGAIAGFLQTGPLFTTDPLKPEWSKISVIKGFSRLFSKKAIVEFLKGIFKIIIVSAAVTITIMPYFDNVEHFTGLSISQGMVDMHSILIKMMIAIVSVLFILAVADYIFQKSQFMEEQMMSLQEIKDEYKQTEGDPHIKGKLRQLREQKSKQRMMQSVPDADVVITNPTHYAVALKYDMQEMQAPILVAKGVDAIALKIKAVAEENDIPLVENAALARALYSSMEIDQVIPEEHFKTVAEVISYIFKLKGKGI